MYQPLFIVTDVLNNDIVTTKSYRYVNKKLKLISQYITPQIPYNKQVFIEPLLRFSTGINLSPFYDFSTNLISDNLAVFNAFFHELNIDLNQFNPLMLILYRPEDDSECNVKNMCS